MTLEEARAIFANDSFATQAAGIRIDSCGLHTARCAMKITSAHLNAMGKVMGGAIYTLADYTFAVAANSEGLQWVSAQSSVNFLSAAAEGILSAEASCEHEGRNTCLYTIKISDGNNKQIAIVSAVGVRVVGNQ